MKIIKKHIVISFVMGLLLAIGLPFEAEAQMPLQKKDKEKAAANISKNYKNWNAAGWEAKVKTDLLPVKATMILTMLRGREIAVSLRVPLMGEVARIEADPDSIWVVNKMKRKYFIYPLARLSDEYGVDFTDIQELLLGKVVVPGQGPISKKHAEGVDIYSTSESGYIVLADGIKRLPDLTYGWGTDPEGLLSGIAFRMAHAEETVDEEGDPTIQDNVTADIAAEVNWNKKGADVQLDFWIKGLTGTADIEAGMIEWGVAPLERLSISSKYQQVGLKEVLKF